MPAISVGVVGVTVVAVAGWMTLRVFAAADGPTVVNARDGEGAAASASGKSSPSAAAPKTSTPTPKRRIVFHGTGDVSLDPTYIPAFRTNGYELRGRGSANHELDTVSRRYQADEARRMTDAGADVIFGHLAHRLRPMGTYHGRPIFYGLGNFVWPNLSDEGSTTAVARVVVTPAERISGRLPPRSSRRRSRGSSLMDPVRVARDLPCRRREARPNETVW